MWHDDVAGVDDVAGADDVPRWHGTPEKNETSSSCSDYQLNFLFFKIDSDSTYLKNKSQNKPYLHDLKKKGLKKERKLT